MRCSCSFCTSSTIRGQSVPASRLNKLPFFLLVFVFSVLCQTNTHDSSLSPCRAFPALLDRVGAFQPSCPYPYHDWQTEILLLLFPAMSETRRLLEAASALSLALRANGVPHAFHGSLFVAVLKNSPQADEIFCIVEGGTVHPFRRVRQALTGNADLSITPSPWSNRLHVKYSRCIPQVEIEILAAGESGPRRLDALTVAIVSRVPFLTTSEFVRAKLNSWMIRGSERDAQDIVFIMTRYWNSIDINRIPEHDMDRFVEMVGAAAPGWAAIKRKYGM
ncbi:hypothetical protein BGY98DRAFT_984501 [Russula aff. rugulosa BPL654]|nr:hypothetical protein BGY98DRAFT_984501 [Russula aff. rugulosa BPL654]